jgi:hypothetical protein
MWNLKSQVHRRKDVKDGHKGIGEEGWGVIIQR